MPLSSLRFWQELTEETVRAVFSGNTRTNAASGLRQPRLRQAACVSAETEILSPSARLFWATGLCGGFTTMSTFMYELSRFGQDAEYWVASGYFLATLVGCALAFWAGTLAVRLLMKA